MPVKLLWSEVDHQKQTVIKVLVHRGSNGKAFGRLLVSSTYVVPLFTEVPPGTSLRFFGDYHTARVPVAKRNGA
jgi:hypothetical protein